MGQIIGKNHVIATELLSALVLLLKEMPMVAADMRDRCWQKMTVANKSLIAKMVIMDGDVDSSPPPQ